MVYRRENGTEREIDLVDYFLVSAVFQAAPAAVPYAPSFSRPVFAAVSLINAAGIHQV